MFGVSLPFAVLASGCSTAGWARGAVAEVGRGRLHGRAFRQRRVLPVSGGPGIARGRGPRAFCGRAVSLQPAGLPQAVGLDCDGQPAFG
jgi:hypothetical protein